MTAARTVDAVFQRAVDGGHDVFGADVCRIAVADDGRFVPAASSADEAVDDLPARPIDAGFAGVTYRSGTPVRVDDLTDTRHASPRAAAPSESSSDPTYRSLLSAPIGDRGVVQLLSSDSAAFDEDDRETVALFASHVETAVDRAEAEADLRAERDRLDEFAGVVAHDLRNPLTIASGRAELLADDAHAPAEHVAPLRTALSRMESIITDILTLARQGETVGGTERVDLSACVDDAWASVDTDGAELRRTDGLGHVHADRGRLQELFENLFRNSVEHGSTADPTSSVTVRVGRLDDAAGFYVADDGPGIPENRRGNVFEYGHSSADAGTGIGLAVVERIAHAHGWEVAVVDAADGGARFEITVE
jgi:signal transduction histidine kinase